MRLKTVFLFLALSLASTFARADGLQSTTFTKTGQSVTVSLLGTGIRYHTITWNKLGTVSACSVRVDSSSDGITWNTGDVVSAQTCTSNGAASITSIIVVNYVRVNVTSFTGTGSVVVAYAAYNNTPATGSGSPGGLTTQVQYNDGGVFAGDSTFTFDKTTKGLTFSARTPLCASGEAWVSNGATEACSPVVSSIPPTTPPSLGATSLTLTVANDTSTGTTLNKLVKLTATGKAIIASAGDITGVIGICASGCGISGDAQITVLGTGSCVTDNATTINHQLIPSSSVAGDCSDAGTTYPTGVLVVGQARDSGAAGVHTVYISTDFASALNPGGGKGQNILINSTSPKVIADFNGTTPAAVAGYKNIVWQNSTSSNTTSVSAYVPARRVCAIIIGADNGLIALVDTDIAPQGRQCFIPFASTVVEIDVAADAGTPNVVVRKNSAGSGTNLLSSALATAGSGGIACSKTTGTTGIDGVTTCSATLQNTSLAAGDYIETITATAGGVAKRMSIFITYTVN